MGWGCRSDEFMSYESEFDGKAEAEEHDYQRDLTEEAHKQELCKKDAYIAQLEGDLRIYETLRDRFAMAALQGSIAASAIYSNAGSMEERCAYAYAYADAMLKARQPKESPTA